MKTSISALLSALALLALNSPLHASQADSRIENAARQSHVFKTYLHNDDITVRSGNGAVTLTGMVAEGFHKTLAQEVVSGLPGVRSVENRLEVEGASPTPNSDAWLRDKVKVALLFTPRVNALATEVEVYDGVVTLRGAAASQAQKALTTQYAEHVEGIRGIRNEMVVSRAPILAHRTAGEKIDDASVSAQVNMTLLNHRLTSVLNTTVRSKRGVVTVRGQAGNAFEKRLVGQLIADINGVKGVRNRMTLK